VAFTQLARLAGRRDTLSRQGSTYALKTPLIVPAGMAVTLALPTAAQSESSLFWTQGAFPPELSGGLAAVGFQACKRNQPAMSFRGKLGVATQFPGAFLVAKRMCLPIEIWVRGRRTPYRRTIAIGVKHC
jgi:hypothetical protein